MAPLNLSAPSDPDDIPGDPSTPLLVLNDAPALSLNCDSTLGVLAIARIQATQRKGESFMTQELQSPSHLLTEALAELQDCLGALSQAEQAMRDQNIILEVALLAQRNEKLRYHALLQAIPVAVLTTDVWGVIREANLAAAQLLGVSLRNLIGSPFAKYVLQGEHLILLSVMTQALVTGASTIRLGLRAATGMPSLTATTAAIGNEEGIFIGLHWLIAGGASQSDETASHKASKAQPVLDSYPLSHTVDSSE